MRQKKIVTLDDVAQDAGVSRSTATMVLREGGLITAETKQKVLKSAQKLGYMNKRSVTAKAPNKNAEVIGVCFPDIGNIFFTSIFIGINDFFDQYSNYTIFFSSHFEMLEKQRHYFENLMQWPVAGLLVAPAIGTSREEMVQLQETGVPLVFVTRYIDGMDANFVAGDNEGGAYAAASHLIESNHKRIAFLGGVSEISPCRDRLKGYRKAMEEHGLTYDESLIVTGPMTREWGYHVVHTLLKLPDPPTAAICYNDIIAEGVIEGLHDMNVLPGSDFSVVKFDFKLGGRTEDEERISTIKYNSAYYNYRDLYQYRNVFQDSTNVRGDIYQWGYEAAKLLFRNIVGLSTETEKIIFPQKLIVHESSRTPL